MSETTQKHPVDYFSPILGRYKALEAMIDEGTDVMNIRSLLEALNETFEYQCDILNAKESP